MLHASDILTAPFMAMLKPVPSLPSMFEAGTRQSSISTVRVGEEFHPSCEKREINKRTYVRLKV